MKISFASFPKADHPLKMRSLHQGTTEYQIDTKTRPLCLFKNFTSRHCFLIHRERLLSLLPHESRFKGSRAKNPSRADYVANGKMLCWEAMVEQALEKSNAQQLESRPYDRPSMVYYILAIDLQHSYRILPQKSLNLKVRKSQFPEGATRAL